MFFEHSGDVFIESLGFVPSKNDDLFLKDSRSE